ncbi:signal peptidase I [Pseudogracilibacillus sp. SO30301A]
MVLIIAVVIRSFLFSPSLVLGQSMEPTFENHDRVIVSKISNIQRFDIIVFDAPDVNEYYIKRVIGLPGDTVGVKDDVLYINGW